MHINKLCGIFAWQKTETKMEKFKNLTKINKTILITALILIIYGYLSRIIGIDFFWESKTVGWTILFFAIITISIENLKVKKKEEKSIILEKIIIGITSFIIFMQCLMYFILIKADSYKAAEKFLFNDKSIQNKVGTVESIVLIPVGGMSMSSSSEGSEGQADYNFIVKGKKDFIDINLIMIKELKTDWEILEIDN